MAISPAFVLGDGNRNLLLIGTIELSPIFILYFGRLEFTKCRSQGKLKPVIFKPLMKLSLLEMRIVESFRHLLKPDEKYSLTYLESIYNGLMQTKELNF